jgi:hypothetical protein
LPDECDIRVFTPNGVEIELPFRVFKQLKKLHLLERDRITGKRRIKKKPYKGHLQGIASHISVRSPTGAQFIGKNAGIRGTSSITGECQPGPAANCASFESGNYHGKYR